MPPIEASRRYGTVKRGFMRCPFHADRTPSLKLYGDHFHCFGCGAHGDVIDLTAGLLGCSKGEAARRLETDFGYGGLVPRPDYGEACLLEAWTGYLLDAGADAGQTRDVERKTARLMEACHG